MNEERTYGVEIEITGTRHLDSNLKAIARALTRAGIPAVAARYGSSDQPEGGNWKVLPDTSCGPEIVSPPLRGKAGLEEISHVCQVLQDVGAEVSSSCGLHVHHDAAGFSVQHMVTISALYAAHQPAINSILRSHGETTISAAAWKPTTWTADGKGEYWSAPTGDSAVQAMQSSRYSAANWYALFRHGTVEFRQHDGTVDSPAVRCWILLTLCVIEAALTRKSLVSKVRHPTGRKHTGPMAQERKLLADLLFALSRVTKGDPDYGDMRKFYEARLLDLISAS